MPSEVKAADEAPAGEAPARAWRPSRQPDHRTRQAFDGPGNYIVERRHQDGFLRTVRRYFDRVSVKIILAVSLFIAAAVLFDATINGGSWTERPPKQRATAHRGAPKPATPVP